MNQQNRGRRKAIIHDRDDSMRCRQRPFNRYYRTTPSCHEVSLAAKGGNGYRFRNHP